MTGFDSCIHRMQEKDIIHIEFNTQRKFKRKKKWNFAGWIKLCKELQKYNYSNLPSNADLSLFDWNWTSVLNKSSLSSSFKRKTEKEKGKQINMIIDFSLRANAVFIFFHTKSNQVFNIYCVLNSIKTEPF